MVESGLDKSDYTIGEDLIRAEKSSQEHEGLCVKWFFRICTKANDSQSSYPSS